MTHHLNLDTVILAKGKHDTCAEGTCLFELYNNYFFDRHTDDCPPDVSLVLHMFGMRLNDCLPDGRRQELKRFLELVRGTRGDGLDETRSYLALDWLVRTFTPAWLDLAGLSVQAQALRDLCRIVDLVAAQAAGPVVRKVREKAGAAWIAWIAAEDAAEDAARDAARAALQPTVEQLQTSAIALYDAMIRPTIVDGAR